MEDAKDKDRLELVRSIRYALGGLGHSLAGWMQWINNPDISSKFSQKELEKMNVTVSDFAESFIEYDLKITKEGVKKGIKERRSTQRRQSMRVFYV